jgi:hypothetical protein
MRRAQAHEQLVGRRAFGVRGYRWCGNVVPPRLPDDERDDLLGQARAICSCLAGAFGSRAVRVDVVWDGGHAWTIEVNPRPRIARGDRGRIRRGRVRRPPAGCAGELPQCRSSRGAAGKAVLFATEDVVIGDSVGWRGGVRDVPPRRAVAAGHPICTLVVVAATPQEALEALEEQAAQLRAELRPGEVAAGGRRDVRRCGAPAATSTTAADGRLGVTRTLRARRCVVRRAGGRALARIEGREASVEEAADAAAAILMVRRRRSSTASGRRASRRSARRSRSPGARRDRRSGEGGAGLAFQAIGSSTATFGEIRDRAGPS